jgi:hypothetical protein
MNFFRHVPCLPPQGLRPAAAAAAGGRRRFRPAREIETVWAGEAAAVLVLEESVLRREGSCCGGQWAGVAASIGRGDVAG